MSFIILSNVSFAADWTPFIIRNANPDGTGSAPTYSLSDGVLTVNVDSSTGGQKVGYGTSYLDGQRLDSLFRFQVVRLDAHPNVYAPYINIWVTDGSHYAVLSLEPSHYPEFDWTHNLLAADYLSIDPWVYETDLSDVSWIKEGAYLGGNGHYLYGSDDNLLTIADIGHLTIKAPSPEELDAGLPGVGSGAPRELGTNVAYGFTLVFGDTQSNYIGGYQIDAGPTLIGGVPDALWVDDDYCETCENEGHIWGYDAFNNIPAAVDAAHNGTNIIVKEGTYEGSLITKSIEIRGNGQVLINSGPMHPAGLSQGFRLMEGSGGTTISHLAFEVDLAIMNGAAVDDVTVDHCTFNNTIQAVSNWRGNGWQISHNVINDLRTRNGGGIGILIADFSGGVVQDNVVSHNKIYGILHVDPADGGGYCGTGIVIYADFRGGGLGAEAISFNRVVKNKVSLVSDTPEVVDVWACELSDTRDDPEADPFPVIFDNAIGFNDFRGSTNQIALTPAELEDYNLISRNLGDDRGHGLHPGAFGPGGN